MSAHPDIASVAKLIGDPARSGMLLRLLDGRAMTATELATGSHVSPQTASSHLSRLRDGGLISLEKQGRHRYYRLAGPEIAAAIEALMSVASAKATGDGTPSIRSGSRHRDGGPGSSGVPSAELPAMELARTCYDHLAGRLGVALADSLCERGWLVERGDDYGVTEAGAYGFASLGIDVEVLRAKRRQFARRCLDWSERRHHIAGSLGAALAQSLVDRKWVLRTPESRTVHITNAGLKMLRDVFGVTL